MFLGNSLTLLSRGNFDKNWEPLTTTAFLGPRSVSDVEAEVHGGGVGLEVDQPKVLQQLDILHPILLVMGADQLEIQ